MQLLKRAIDLMAGLPGLLLISPLLLGLALAIQLDDGGPVFFRQQRAGLKGQVFKIFKFRTMVQNAENLGAGVFVEEEDPRITGAGKVMRRFSLDELPQLINILRGEMSLVGPRPTLPYQVDNYDARQKKRLNVKPGVTGWAQVNGRSALSWPERIELDLWYINNWSLVLDLRIILKTFKVIFEKSNLYSQADYDPIAGEKGLRPGKLEGDEKVSPDRAEPWDEEES